MKLCGAFWYPACRTADFAYSFLDKLVYQKQAKLHKLELRTEALCMSSMLGRNWSLTRFHAVLLPPESDSFKLSRCA